MYQEQMADADARTGRDRYGQTYTRVRSKVSEAANGFQGK